MRLFNQSKHQLGWSMGGQSFTCEPWGSVDVPEELVGAAKSRGLPLGPVQVAPEVRAHVRIAEERAAADQAPLLALRKEADEALAREKAAIAELERCQGDLARLNRDYRETNERIATLTDKLARAEADKAAAETLLSETSAQATASEARAIKAEALLSEKQPKAKPAKQTET